MVLRLHGWLVSHPVACGAAGTVGAQAALYVDVGVRFATDCVSSQPCLTLGVMWGCSIAAQYWPVLAGQLTGRLHAAPGQMLAGTLLPGRALL